MNLVSQTAAIPMNQGLYHSNSSFELESGESLSEFEISYTTFGELSPKRDNVIWVVHALTGDANPAEWWNGLVGEDKFYDPADHFIICANFLGSCYGSTNPLSMDPKTHQAFYYDFPDLTTRDLARSLNLLKNHLKIDQIHTLIGGSLGGQVALEWAYTLGKELKNLVVLASTSKSSPWVIGFNESQRMAIQADQTWGMRKKDAGKKGLEAARAIAMLSYRHPEDFMKKQSDQEEKLDHFKSSSYLRYQGEKLANRFNALSYWTLSKTMDSHNLSRHRGTLENALSKISARTLSIGVNSDLLFLPDESQFISKHVPFGTYKEIQSDAGHDAFLIEFEQLAYLLKSFYLEQEKIN